MGKVYRIKCREIHYTDYVYEAEDEETLNDIMEKFRGDCINPDIFTEYLDTCHAPDSCEMIDIWEVEEDE